MGVLEIHVWDHGSISQNLPDRLVFDFDPHEDVPFAKVKSAARGNVLKT
jgi:bifunctional non-homologous end joining protein LigD